MLKFVELNNLHSHICKIFAPRKQDPEHLGRPLNSRYPQGSSHVPVLAKILGHCKEVCPRNLLASAQAKITQLGVPTAVD